MDDKDLENTLQALGSTILSNVVYSTLNQRESNVLNDDIDEMNESSGDDENDDDDDQIKSTLSKNETQIHSQNVPFIINLFLNLITTLALSLAIYLLMTNSFLFLHKLKVDNLMLESEIVESLQLRHNSQRHHYKEDQQKYDCGFSQPLTYEECKQLSRYEKIINKFKEEIQQYSSNTDNQNVIENHVFKVNTSIYAY